MVAAIAGLLGAPWNVDSHLGRFTEADLVKFLTAAPAVRVSALDLSDFRIVSDEGTDVLTMLGIYVVTKDTTLARGRDEVAILAVEGIVKLCDRFRWGLGAFVKGDGGVRGARNLYSKEALANGVAFWALDYRVSVRLSPTPEDVVGALTSLWVGISPDIGAGHQDDYIEIVGGDA